MQKTWRKYQNYQEIMFINILKSYLQETKTHFTYSVNDTNGKLAITGHVNEQIVSAMMKHKYFFFCYLF